MPYTISEVARLTGLSKETLRYYDRVGLLPTLERGEKGIRLFDEDAIIYLDAVAKLKSYGLSINEIRCYKQLYGQGAYSIPDRLFILKRQRKILKHQIAECQTALNNLNALITRLERELV
jgi:DNA-binding transcriptional MerR regulator